jgi:putative addiction module component (TIGR02574 family)
MATPVLDLPVAERLKLVEDIWDSIAAEQEHLPLTSDQRAELDSRLDEFDVDGEPGDLAGDVLTRIRKSL